MESGDCLGDAGGPRAFAAPTGCARGAAQTQSDARISVRDVVYCSLVQHLVERIRSKPDASLLSFSPKKIHDPRDAFRISDKLDIMITAKKILCSY